MDMLDCFGVLHIIQQDTFALAVKALCKIYVERSKEGHTLVNRKASNYPNSTINCLDDLNFHVSQISGLKDLFWGPQIEVANLDRYPMISQKLLGTRKNTSTKSINRKGDILKWF